MTVFRKWFNAETNLNSVMKARIAHFGFVTTHPFDDGNGCITLAIADMHLARFDKSSNRFFNMSALIRKELNVCCEILERTQKETMDVSIWFQWFLSCLDHALSAPDETLSNVLRKACYREKMHSFL